MSDKKTPAKPDLVTNNSEPAPMQRVKAYFNKDQHDALNAPLRSSVVSTRNQSGRDLSYIEGYHAINEANRIFGFDNWDVVTEEVALVCEVKVEIGAKKTPGVEVGYRARVHVFAGGSVRVQHGFGTGRASNPMAAHELAIKEAETDALKRALRTFGNQFGNALYDKEQRQVVDDEAIAEAEAKAKRIADKKAAKGKDTAEEESASESKPEVASASGAINAFLKAIDACESEEALKNFKSDNKAKISALGADDRQKVVDHYNDKKRKL